MSLIYLYTYNLPVQLFLTDHQSPLTYSRPMYTYNTKVYKNNDNIIEFVVRNNDRVPVRLIGATMSIVIQHVATQTVVIEKNLEITDEVNGRAQVTLTADDIRNWSLGSYQYNVRINRNKGKELLYLDINNNTFGTFDLYEGIGGTLIPAQTILGSQLTNVTPDWDNPHPSFVSGAMDATNDSGNQRGLFSIVIYQTNWMGTFKVQGSLQNLAPTDVSWFDIDLYPGINSQLFDGTSNSCVGISFAINVRWVRFVVDPDVNNLGTFDKIIYKIS